MTVVETSVGSQSRGTLVDAAVHESLNDKSQKPRFRSKSKSLPDAMQAAAIPPTLATPAAVALPAATVSGCAAAARTVTAVAMTP